MLSARLPASPRISAVVISLNEGTNLRSTVENLADTLPGGSEIVVVDDGSGDGSADFLERSSGPARLFRSKNLGVARARNFGGRHSSGEVIVFADAHIGLQPQWWQSFVELLANEKVGAVAPAIVDVEKPDSKGYGLSVPAPDLEPDWLDRQADGPHPVPLLPGCCVAMRRDTFQATGGFDDGLCSHGSDDAELSLRLWLLGYELLVVPEVEVRHLFRTRFPYPVRWKTVLYNRLRMAFAHLGSPRLAKVIAALRRHKSFWPALTLNLERDVLGWRAELLARRSRNDDWFFGRFGIEW
jgi:GT2 family glycosyltransferase